MFNIIIIVFWLWCGRLSGLLFFRPPALLFSILTHLFLPPSSVSLSYFILAVPIRECLGKHSCMSSLFPIATLNGTSSFLSLVQENINVPADTIIGFVPEVAVTNHLIKFTSRPDIVRFKKASWQLMFFLLCETLKDLKKLCN